MKRSHLNLILAALAAATAGAPPARAGLLAHFKLDEGTIDPATNVVYSANSTNTGAFAAGASAPLWSAADLAPVPASEGGTTAFLDHQLAGTFGGYTITDVQPPLGAAARTFTAWVKAPPSLIGANAGLGTILSYGNTTPTFTRFSFRVDPANGGRLRTEISGAAVVGNTVVADGKWHHVAVVAPNNAYMSNLVLYVDGNRQTFTVNSAPGQDLRTGANTAATLYPLYLGVSIHNLGATFSGGIDEVKVYDEALTDSQIIQMVYGNGTAPIIAQNPQNARAILGATNASVSFNIGLSSGSPPLNFQWKKDGVNLGAGTNQVLTVSPVTAASMGAYSVGVTNPFGSALSASASLSWATPPLEPSEQTVLVGGHATFTATLPADSAGYTYQWLKGGQNLAGATNSAYSIFGATLGDAGTYSVQVTLAGQTATSAPAPLQVLPPSASRYANAVLSGPVAAYWRLGESDGAQLAVDVTGFHSGYLSNFVAGELGAPGALLNDPDTAATFAGDNCAQAPYSPALQHSTAFSVEAWVQSGGSSGSVVCSRNQYLSSGYELAQSGGVWQFRTGYSTSPASEDWNDLNAGTVNTGEWQHVVATYDGVTKNLYVDGQWVGSQSVPVLPVNEPLRIGAGQTYQTLPGNFFNGAIDEVAVYWQALTADQVAQHYSIGALGPNVPPVLLEAPQASTNYAGAQVHFFAAAQGSYPLAYQWLKNGANLPDATSATLVLDDITAADQGSYAVRVSNNAGATNSPGVALTVVAITQSGYPATILSDGPAAYFPLDDPTTAGNAVEIANFGAYQGLYNGSPGLRQPGATALTGFSAIFDGASQSVTFDNYPGLNYPGQVSLEAWIQPANALSSGGFGDILAHGYGGTPTREVALRVASGNYEIASYDGSSHGVTLAVPASDIGSWVHLVGTYDGAAWSLYRNGALSARSTNAIGALKVDAGWGIGASSTGTDRFFAGGIDEAAIYTRALTPAQVARHYVLATGGAGAVSVARSGSSITLKWNVGLLEEAPDLAGPWAGLPTLISPVTLSATAPRRFYRVRW